MKTSTSPSRSTDRVIESFQQTMQAFLEVQKSTMLAYLAGRGAADHNRQSPVFTRLRPSDRRGPGLHAIELSLSLKIVNGNGSAAEPSERSTIMHKQSDGIGRSHESNGTDGIEMGKAARRTRCKARRDGTGSLDDHHAAARDRSGSDRLPDRDTWGSTSTWRPTWESTRSSGSRSWGSCAMSFRD